MVCKLRKIPHEYCRHHPWNCLTKWISYILFLSNPLLCSPYFFESKLQCTEKAILWYYLVLFFAFLENKNKFMTISHHKTIRLDQFSYLFCDAFSVRLYTFMAMFRRKPENQQIFSKSLCKRKTPSANDYYFRFFSLFLHHFCCPICQNISNFSEENVRSFQGKKQKKSLKKM